jgi:predicted nucleic acid-binding protein
MRFSVEDFDEVLISHPNIKNGCLVDTNILFAASYPSDIFNGWAEKAFTLLSANQIPIYTNASIQSEFLEIYRRHMIPEALLELYNALRGQLEFSIEGKLKSLETKSAKKRNEGTTLKFNDRDIKDYRKLLTTYSHASGMTGWELFCQDYFSKFITNAWADVVKALKIRFIESRTTDNLKHFFETPSSEGMISIMGSHGVGSTDALILNTYQKSNYSLIITADEDIVSVVEKLCSSKHVLTPRNSSPEYLAGISR